MNLSEKFQIPGVKFVENAAGLPIIEVKTSLASASISLSGAHVFSFIPAGEKEVLWVSRKSEFAPGKAMRGGIPVCWPWFGTERPDAPAHGFVRRALWEVAAVEALENGAIRIALMLDSTQETFPLAEFSFRAGVILTIAKSLEVTLLVLNRSDRPVKTSGALHSYFAVSNVAQTAVSGLDGVPYQEYAASAPRIDGWTQEGDIHISGEIDRVYHPTEDTVEIVDPGYGRVIRIEKFGSRSTVVWNPGPVKAATMADFDAEQYPEMLCVESANARGDGRVLAPGIPHMITQKISLV